MPAGGDSPHSLRLWTAFAIAPCVAAVLAYALFPLLTSRTGQIVSPRDPSLALAIIAFVAGSFVTGIGAVPIVFTLLRRGQIPLEVAVRWGALLGNVPFALYVFGLVVPFTLMHIAAGTITGRWIPVADLVSGGLRMVILGSALGAASGAAFWFLGLREPWSGQSGGLGIREP